MYTTVVTKSNFGRVLSGEGIYLAAKDLRRSNFVIIQFTQEALQYSIVSVRWVKSIRVRLKR